MKIRYLIVFLITQIVTGQFIKLPPVKVDSLKITTTPTTITTATKVLVLDENGVFRLSKPNIGITALDTLTVNPYFGIRLKPKDATVSGFHIEKNINGLVGYSVKNEDETGNGSNSGFTARGLGTTQYNNFVGIYHYNGNYGIASLRNTGAITSDRIVSIWNYGTNAPYIDFLTGETLMTPTSKLRIFQNGQLKLGVQPALATTNDDLVSINADGNVTKTKKLELQETDNAETLYFSGQDSSDISGAKRLSYGKTPDYAQIDYYNVAHNTILEDYVLEAGDLDNFLINDGVITFNYVLGKYYDSENDTEVTFQAELYQNTTSTSPFAISELSEVLGNDYSFEGKLKARVIKTHIEAGQRLMVKIRVFYANTAITQDFIATHGNNLGSNNSNLSMFELPINKKHHISQTIANDITALVPSVDAVYDFVKSEVASIPTPEANVSGGTETFFFTGETDDLAGIKTLNPTKQPLASQISSFLNDVQNNVVEETYVFKLDTDHPHYIPKGVGKIYFKAVKTLGDKEAKLKFTLRKFKDGVVNETFATSEESTVITTSDEDYEVTFPILNNVIIDAQNGESIRIDVIPTYTAGTTETDLIIKMMGTTGTRLVIPIDDTSPITQDLTIGLKNVAPSSDKVTQALNLKQDKPTDGTFAFKHDLNLNEVFWMTNVTATGIDNNYRLAYRNQLPPTAPPTAIGVKTDSQTLYTSVIDLQGYHDRYLPKGTVKGHLKVLVNNTGIKKTWIELEIYERVYINNIYTSEQLLSTIVPSADLTNGVNELYISANVNRAFIESGNTLVFVYRVKTQGAGNEPNFTLFTGHEHGTMLLVPSDKAVAIATTFNASDTQVSPSSSVINSQFNTRLATFTIQDRFGLNNFPIPALIWSLYTFRNSDTVAATSYQRYTAQKVNGVWTWVQQ